MTASRLEHNQRDGKANVERAPAEDDEERLRREVNRGECCHGEEERWRTECCGMERERERKRLYANESQRTRHAALFSALILKCSSLSLALCILSAAREAAAVRCLHKTPKKKYRKWPAVAKKISSDAAMDFQKIWAFSHQKTRERRTHDDIRIMTVPFIDCTARNVVR